jgi:uncharacterized membrane protein
MNSLTEPRSISLLKSISYRLFGTLVTFLGCYLFTGKAVLSLGVGVFDFFSKIVLFYLHERAWVHVPEWIHKLNRAVLKVEKLEKGSR